MARLAPTVKGWQTAPLNALKSRMLWLHWLVKLPRGLAEVLGSFDGWQMALLNALRSRMPWPDWRLKLPKAVAFCELWHCEGLANGTVGRPEEHHWLVKLARGLAEVLGSFDGWQTALLNAS